MSRSFVPCGVITLTTDFGHKGPFVATMKGAMLSRFPGARIVDLTHEIVPHWPAEAGFWLERSYRYFPLGTAHVAVVDPGVGTERNIIAVDHDGHAFVAPDNGLLAPLIQRAGSKAKVHVLDMERLSKIGITRVSTTFHGRDILAPVTAELAAGRCHVKDLGPATDASELVPSWVEEPSLERGVLKGVVITTDNFGNLITNIDRTMLTSLKSPVVIVGGHEIPLERTYGDVKPGEYLALINSFDVLEIARSEQSASEGLGAGRGAPISVRES